MLTSFGENIPNILQAVANNGSNNILDIGHAFGKYGVLIVEGLASVRSEAGDLCPDISDIVIDGCEQSEYFKNIPWLDSVYNKIYWQDIRINPELCNGYGLILLIDVIEHWEKEDFWKFKEKVKVPMLISTPKKVCMYKDRHFDFDGHCSQWDISEFEVKADYSNEKSLIIII